MLLNLPHASRYIVAYSGGCDSHVLLHLLAQRKETPVVAVHVHHGISDQADAWVLHCKQVCADLAIPFFVLHVKVDVKKGESLQAVARDARYAALEKFVQKGDVLLTAHHLNDQAETLLLRLLRGSGPQGLSGIPRNRSFGPGHLIRPLLNISREEIMDYAYSHDLKWIDDPSNAYLGYDRNFLRHEIMPKLAEIRPGTVKAFARSAQLCAEASIILQETAKRDLVEIYDLREDALIISKLNQLSTEYQRNVLRFWLQKKSQFGMSEARISEALDQLLFAQPDASPKIRIDQLVLRRYRDKIYALPLEDELWSGKQLTWDLKTPLMMPDKQFVLKAVDRVGAGIQLPNPLVKPITVGFRQGGEVCQFQGSGHHVKLKKFFQEQGIPPWSRDRVPLVYYGDELIAVVGYGYTEAYSVQDKQKRGLEFVLENV